MDINRIFLTVKSPIKCHLWKKKKLTPKDLQFEEVKSIIESSHFDRSIYKCKRCGQLYFYEFYEEIDWLGGNDKIYTTYIPIDADEKIIENLNERTPLELLAVSPMLRWDSDDKIVWVK